MALRIKELLYDEQYTIAGAKKKLATELRSPGRDTGIAPPKSPLRSLKPPPSLAARFATTPQPASQPADEPKSSSSARQIANQLREILDLLDRGDEELEALRARAKGK